MILLIFLKICWRTYQIHRQCYGSEIFPNTIVLLKVDRFKGFSNRNNVDKLVISSMSGCTVPLNYNFTFTRVSTRVTTRGSRGRCQNLPWKGSFPRDGPWLFHAKTRGISRHVAFPRNELWNFHETSYRAISRGIFTRPVVVELKSQWLVKAFTIRNLFTIELF